MSEAAVMDEVRGLIRNGTLHDDPKSPTLFIVAVVGAQRSDRTDDAYRFVIDLGRKYPHAELVIGDTSNLEKEAANAAEDIGLAVTVIKKADKGDWDEGAAIRDERVVGKATVVVAFDESSRSKEYERFAKRLGKRFHLIAREATKP